MMNIIQFPNGKTRPPRRVFYPSEVTAMKDRLRPITDLEARDFLVDLMAGLKDQAREGDTSPDDRLAIENAVADILGEIVEFDCRSLMK